jgi:flagella basal body P-ring formation protein FlgA
MNDNQRPLSHRKTLHFLVILLLLIAATETLLHQWGFGQVAPQPPQIDGAPTRFMPTDRTMIPGTLELRSEATVVGDAVALRSICRWSDADNATFSPLADLTLIHLPRGRPYRLITVAEVRQALRDAGVNVGMIDFTGANACTVNRGDVTLDEHAALLQWISARQGGAGAAGTDAAGDAAADAMMTAQQTLAAARSVDPARLPTVAVAAMPLTGPDGQSFHTLRQRLMIDLAARLGMAVDSLQVEFNPADDKVLNLVEPAFRFSLAPVHVRDLGRVSWNVEIVTDQDNRQVTVEATARAWESQLVVARLLAARQVIRDSDVVERRVLIDQMGDAPVLTRAQAIGQEAARDLKPGTVLTGRLVDPVPLCKSGDLVTVTVERGNVRLRTVARAMESGAFGETIRVRNEATKDIYDVVLTGPQEGRLGPAASPAVASGGGIVPP